MITGELYIQCYDKNTGKTGSFIRQGNHTVSPVFRDLIELLDWMNKNKWRRVPGSNFHCIKD